MLPGVRPPASIGFGVRYDEEEEEDPGDSDARWPTPAPSTPSVTAADTAGVVVVVVVVVVVAVEVDATGTVTVAVPTVPLPRVPPELDVPPLLVLEGRPWREEASEVEVDLAAAAATVAAISGVLSSVVFFEAGTKSLAPTLRLNSLAKGLRVSFFNGLDSVVEERLTPS